jgi:hypothetical protein
LIDSDIQVKTIATMAIRDANKTSYDMITDMSETTAELFLSFSRDRLQLLASRIIDCVGRLSNDQLWARGSANENSIGNLVLHLCGNVHQRIVSGVGGETDVRDRDSEFAARGGLDGHELQRRLETTIKKATEVIRTVPTSRLSETIAVQNQRKTVIEVIYAVVEHFAQHTGQIIFATKMLTGTDLGYYKHLSQPPDIP